ncbi:MAG: hypothetical protein E4G90_06695 [Gemmatimonadales bacterium]|nr:MAG: hypothetical protein E4G90_06695 [Gemmatimonadales bacterium]
MPTMKTVSRIVAITTLTVALSAAPTDGLHGQTATFEHARHAGFFPECTTCHGGISQEGQSIWPSPNTCAACHDGTNRQAITFEPREGPRPTNLKFTHPVHSFVLEQCRLCHVESEEVGDRMQVQRAVISRCLACHGLEGEHPSLEDNSCTLCHLPLSEATQLSPESVAGFPRPTSHEEQGFTQGGHGALAAVPGEEPGAFTIAASCATCHARNQCITCHVNAPELGPIQALEEDNRALSLGGAPQMPESHSLVNWDQRHSAEASKSSVSCATCHTKESCLTCHTGNGPQPVRALPSGGPGRGAGVQLTRTPPASHTWEFRDRHGSDAATRPVSCETCHVRETCLTCHRPDASAAGDYHPAGFLTRHPSSAWSREADCSDCHNPAQFCQDCHKQAGLVAGKFGGSGGRGYHDGFQAFLVGHGQAARQSLESCASCHVERDCTRCHAARGIGYGFNPHGPGFNADRLKKKNPTLCIACHGRTIP